MADLPTIPPSTRAPSPTTLLQNLKDYVSEKPDTQASPAVNAVAKRFSEMEERIMKTPPGIVALAFHEEGERLDDRLKCAAKAYRKLRRTDREGGDIACPAEECELAIEQALCEHERLSAIIIRENLRDESICGSGGLSPEPGDPPAGWQLTTLFRLRRSRLATIVLCGLAILLGFVLPEAQATNVDRAARGGDVAIVDGEAISKKALDH